MNCIELNCIELHWQTFLHQQYQGVPRTPRGRGALKGHEAVVEEAVVEEAVVEEAVAEEAVVEEAVVEEAVVESAPESHPGP